MVLSAQIVLIFCLVFNCALVSAQQVIWYGAWNNGTYFRYSTTFGVYVEILVDQRTPVSYDTVVINAASYTGQMGAANFSATGKYKVWIGPLLPQDVSPGSISLSVKQFTSEVTSISVHVQDGIVQTGLVIYDISFTSTHSSSTVAATASAASIAGTDSPPGTLITGTMSSTSTLSSSSSQLSQGSTSPPSTSLPTDGTTNRVSTTTDTRYVTENSVGSTALDSKRSQPNVGAIVGATAAVFTFLCLCIFFVIRRRRKVQSAPAFPEPYLNLEIPAEKARVPASTPRATKVPQELAQTNEQGRENGTGPAPAPELVHATVYAEGDDAPPAYVASPASPILPSQPSPTSPSGHITAGFSPMTIANHSDSIHPTLTPHSSKSPLIRKE
ncbi:SubName: Full=Uncharacterized protein {ECO:0000313/EMBL:CCA73862.1} [Serendipita indica DSM 11827]|nr:SubName: Full=Uncharacterized protein {ECO:0000313/EMBL:CCA73862.1} [Serendipita indica DSM 11827]